MPFLTGLGIALIAILLTLLAVTLWRLTGAFRQQASYRLLQPPPSTSKAFLSTLASLAEAIPTQGDISQVWTDIDRIQQTRLDAIAAAENVIQFETYIMNPGQRANDFADALIERAQAGVCVRLLVDAYGTHTMPPSYWHRLENAGAEIRRFNPFDWRSPFDYLNRTHRKLLTIDGKRALVGGAGISDLWDKRPDEPNVAEPWCDIEFELRGTVVDILTQLFARHWLFANGVVDLNSGSWKCEDGVHDRSQMAVASGSNPTYRTSSMLGLMQTLACSAEKRFWIASPYFLPNKNLLQTLVQAKNRGVDVRVLTMGEHNDKPPVRIAARERYGPLLERDIEIYEYADSMMHAKLLLADDLWVNFGSANVDPRSLFHNEELNILVRDRHLAQQLDTFFKKAFEHSHQILRSDWRQRSLVERIQGRLGLIFHWQL